jgi:hypothetical protein
MTDINVWNATDDNNNAAAPAGWPEGMMPSGVNNAARAMMGSLKRWRDQSQPTVTATGSGNAQIITYPVAPAAFAYGDIFTFYAHGNTGPMTLQVNAQAAKAVLTSNGAALSGGEMLDGAAVAVVYDGGNFRILAPTAAAVGAMPITGGTMTGPLTVTQLTSTGNINASGTVAAGALTVTGTGYFGGTVQIHGAGGAALLVDNGGITAAGGSTFPNVVLTGGGGTVLSVPSGGISVAGGSTFSNLVLNGGGTAVLNVPNGGIYVAGDTAFGASLSISGIGYFGGDLQVHGSGSQAILVDNGGINVAGASRFGGSVTATSYITSSDARLKADIAALQPGSLELVQRIVPRSYRLPGASDPQTLHWGFVAQEVGQVMRHTGRAFGGHVVDKASGREGLEYNELVAVLWDAVRELSVEVETLKQAAHPVSG